MVKASLSAAAMTAACLVIASSAAHAEPPAVATVTGQGSGSFAKAPDHLRVEVLILARGSSHEEALANVRKRVTAVREQLRDFGASEDAIEEELPTTVQARSEPNSPFSLVPGAIQSEPLAPVPLPSLPSLHERPGGDRPRAKAAKPASLPRVVAVALVADLPLNSTDPAKLPVKAEQLQGQVRAAQLSGIKALGIPAQDLDIPACGSCKVEPGDPGFLYVARFGLEERQQALSEAFRAARDEASALARASGSMLGPLQSLASQSRPEVDTQALPGLPARPALSGSMRRADEAANLKLKKLVFRATVSATFGLVTTTR